MNEPIVSREEIKRRARIAFEAGKPETSCPFPFHSAAYQTWHEEYARLKAESLQSVAAG